MKEWKEYKLGTIGITYSGLTGKTKNDFGIGSAHYISFLNVLNNPIIDIKSFERVIVGNGEKQNRALKGDLFFNTSSETPEEVGICAMLNDSIDDLYLNSFCFGYRVLSKDVYPLYLSYFFRSKQGRLLMSSLAQGVTRYNISKKAFNERSIKLPPLSEQTRIASALSDVDALLASLDKLIAKKQAIKEGTMQQLLTGKTRLKGFDGEWEGAKEWKEYNLGKIGITYSGLTGKTKNDFGIGSAHYISFLNVLNNPIVDIKSFEMVNVGNGEKQNRALKGDLFFNTSSETPEEVGICAMLNDSIDDLYLNSFCFGYRVLSKDVYPLYLSYFFRSKQGRLLMSSLAQGVTRYNISKKAFNEKSILLPPLEEQQAIASILTEMDSELSALQAKRKKYEAIKQGMMQQLLTGKVRLI